MSKADQRKSEDLILRLEQLPEELGLEKKELAWPGYRVSGEEKLFLQIFGDKAIEKAYEFVRHQYLARISSKLRIELSKTQREIAALENRTSGYHEKIESTSESIRELRRQELSPANCIDINAVRADIEGLVAYHDFLEKDALQLLKNKKRREREQKARLDRTKTQLDRLESEIALPTPDNLSQTFNGIIAPLSNGSFVGWVSEIAQVVVKARSPEECGRKLRKALISALTQNTILREIAALPSSTLPASVREYVLSDFDSTNKITRARDVFPRQEGEREDIFEPEKKIDPIIIAREKIAALTPAEKQIIVNELAEELRSAQATSPVDVMTPVEQVRKFASIQFNPKLGGVDGFQKILDRLKGTRFESLNDMREFAAEVMYVCRSFEERKAIKFVNADEPMIGNLYAFLSQGNPAFTVRDKKSSTGTGGEAWILPAIELVNAPPDGRRKMQ